jgi:molybdate transport repressor ModE-like protein
MQIDNAEKLWQNYNNTADKHIKEKIVENYIPLIKRIEKRLNMRLLDRRRGGETGGGAMLTVAGKKLMREYREVLKQVNISIKQISEDFNVRIKSIAGD